MEFNMLNKIINSPYALGLALYLIGLTYRFTTSTLISVLGLFLTIAAVAGYTYFLNKKALSAAFKIRAVLVEILMIFGLEQLLFQRVSHMFSGFEPALRENTAFIVGTLIVGIPMCIGISYLLLTVGNNLGLLALKKRK